MKWEGEFPPTPPANRTFVGWSDLLDGEADRAWLRERRRLAEIRAFSEAWNRGDIRPPRRIDIEGPGWAAPIYWLESLSRARWWAWLRRRIAKWID